MKCENCGAEIKLEDRYCPYCGALNKAAMQHIQDMDRFEDEFEQTQQEVQTKVRGYSSIITRAVILAILFAAIVICHLADRNAYYISESMTQREAEKNADEATAQMDAYLQSGDLQRLASFGDLHEINMSDLSDFTSYRAAIRASQEYSDIMSCCEQIIFARNDDDTASQVSMIAQDLQYFYQYTESEYDYEDNDEITAKVREIGESQIKAVFVTYFGMTDDELENMESMTQGQILTLLEKGAQQYADETEE